MTMFHDLLPDLSNPGPLILLLITVLSIRYLLHNARTTRAAKGAPATFPYLVPFLGTVPLTYLLGPRAFILNKSNFFQTPHPTRIKLLTTDFYVLRGPENLKALFKTSWACTSIPFVKFALGYAFGLPGPALAAYDRDDSGGNHVPHPESTVEARNRVDYRVHASLVQFLEGKGLGPFWGRFVGEITGRVGELWEREGGREWEEEDLMRVVGDELTLATLEALCGPYLLRLNPNFLRDFWVFDRNVPLYLQGIPKFLAPKAYAARERVWKAVQIWQQHAREKFTDAALDADGDDPYWGSSFFRERQRIFSEIDGFDFNAIAAQDLGAVWAMRNAISSTSWSIFDIYKDSELLASVRDEVDACVLDGHVKFDIEKLFRQPFLQAVYAETLRLRMHFYIIRMGDRDDLNIQDWIIPKRKVVVTSTTVAHMDTDVWSTGVNGEHPVDEFWVGRFLKFPMDGSKEAPTFSMKGLEGAWIPYGGGTRQCPGRHFAKRQILLTIALFVRLFDVEILEGGRDVKEDFSIKMFGFGVSSPAGKVPVRMRRRELKGV